MNNRYAILGASRGLGRALFEKLSLSDSQAQFFLASRKINEAADHILSYKIDFSMTPVPEDFLKKLSDFNPHYIVYTAGGGPYGFFEKKKWDDHIWAMNVNFMFPAQLFHVIAHTPDRFPLLKSITFVGSSIAESQPDKMASSYAAAKHSLKGLVSTVQAENNLRFKVNLFSPGYMLTDMLPLNSAPRLENRALSATTVAEQLAQLIASS